MTRTIIRDTTGDRVFMAFNYLVLSLLLLIILYPLIYMLSASFSSGQAVSAGRVWLWPVEPTLAGYEAIFKNRMVLVGFYNSFLYTVVGTFVNVVMTILAASPLSRPDLPGRRIIAFLFFFTLLFSGGIIPLAILLLVLSLGGILSSGIKKILLMQNPLNLRSSEVIDTYVYSVDLVSVIPNFSYATAIGLFKSVVGLILVVAANQLAARFGCGSKVF